jgi:hypothetical protein
MPIPQPIANHQTVGNIGLFYVCYRLSKWERIGSGLSAEAAAQADDAKAVAAPDRGGITASPGSSVSRRRGR